MSFVKKFRKSQPKTEKMCMIIYRKLPLSLEEVKMYIGYAHDRKSLGYECLRDVECGNKLVENEILLVQLFILVALFVFEALFGGNENGIVLKKKDLYV